VASAGNARQVLRHGAPLYRRPSADRRIVGALGDLPDRRRSCRCACCALVVCARHPSASRQQVDAKKAHPRVGRACLQSWTVIMYSCASASRPPRRRPGPRADMSGLRLVTAPAYADILRQIGGSVTVVSMVEGSVTVARPATGCGLHNVALPYRIKRRRGAEPSLQWASDAVFTGRSRSEPDCDDTSPSAR
jgi:hypothetical protein